MKVDTMFSVLVTVCGNYCLYRKVRDELLGHPDELRPVLADRKNDKDWKVLISALILEGWLEHGSIYREVLHDLDTVDIREVNAEINGLPRLWGKLVPQISGMQGALILPLCWEVLLKEYDFIADWRLILFFHILIDLPDERSVHPLLWLARYAEDEAIAAEATRTLAQLPHELVREPLARACEDAERVATVMRYCWKDLEGT